MRAKMPVRKGGRMFKKGSNLKKKMLKSRNEVAVKFITDIIARHGLDFTAKLTQILRIHQANKPHTYDQFGLVNFVEKTEGKLVGEITNKRPDLRVIEVGLDGKEAAITKLEVPVHPLQTAEVTEVAEYLKSEKYGKEAFEFDVEESVTEENRLLVRNVLQVRCGIDALVSLAGTKVTVKKFDSKKDKRNDVWLWDKPYVRFVLHRNLRYANILERAAKHVGVPIAKFQKCRMENSAGYTLQVLQLEKVEPALIQQAFERTMSIVSDFEFTDQVLEADKYQGYRTKAVVRKLKMTEEEVKKAMDLFSEKGYLNYFGISPNDLLRTPRYDIGKHIVKNDFSTAGKAIIRPRPLDRDIYEELKEFIFVANDPRIVVPAFKFLKLKESNDLTAKIVTAMVDNRHGKLEGKFATQAFAKADPKQVMEYTDAFLNVIWNQTVNKLVEKRGGVTLAVGDLVFVDEAAEHFILYECSPNSSVLRESVKEGQKSYKEYVKALTEDDIKSGKYTPFDLVIPVLGFDVKYPDNEVSTFIDELLNKNDISSKDWFQKAHANTVHGVQVTFRGTYRRVLEKPKNLTYKMEKYVDEKLPLFLQDIPVRKREEPEKTEEKTDGEKTETEEAKENETKNGEEAKPVEEKKPAEEQDALILDFFVPKGTQTVIALRELFKKNDFGDLAAPFSERISDKNFSSRCKEKMKFLLNHCKNLQMRGPPMGPGPMMRGPMLPPVFMPGPPMGRPMGPDPNARIHMLEQELLNLKRKTQKLDNNSRPQRGGGNNRGMGNNANNRGNGPRAGNVNASPQKAQPQNKQQLNNVPAQQQQQNKQNLRQRNNAPQNNNNRNNRVGNNQQQQQQGNMGNNNARNNNNRGNNNNSGFGNNPNNRQMQQQQDNNSSWNNSANQNNFGNSQFRGQNQGQKRNNFNNSNNGNANNRGFNQPSFSNPQQNFNTNFNDDNDFTNDFIPPPMKRNRFDNNSGQLSNVGNRNGGGFGNNNRTPQQNNFSNNRNQNQFGNNLNGNNRFGANNPSNNIQGLFERRNIDFNDFTSDVNTGNSFGNNQNRGGFMAGGNRNNFGGGNRRGNFNF
uniref:CSON013793 protein n=1 Tax=Culicoides sonorensis TaxID=179676 RepID=A0A336KZI7_CULSO